MRTLAILLILSTPAAAQTLPDWSNGACGMSGIWYPARAFGQCVATDARSYAQTYPPPSLSGVVHLPSLTSSTVTVTNTPNFSCPADREIVMDAGGTYKCAKDLTDPK